MGRIPDPDITQSREDDDYADPIDVLGNENIYDEPIKCLGHDTETHKEEVKTHEEKTTSSNTIPHVNSSNLASSSEHDCGSYLNRKQSLSNLFHKISGRKGKEDTTGKGVSVKCSHEKGRKFSLQEHRLSSAIYKLVKGHNLAEPQKLFKDSSYQLDSSSWEFLNQTDADDDILLKNCFSSKRDMNHRAQSEDNFSIYESECDSGRSTMDSTQLNAS